MAKDFTEAVEDEIAATTKKVVVLVKIGYSGDYIKASSIPIAVSYGGDAYESLDANLEEFAQSLSTASSARISFPPYPNAVAALVVNDLLRGETISIYKGYLDADNEVIADPDLCLVGRYEAGQVMESGVTITVVEGAGAKHGKAPRQRIVPPLFNHAPEPGEKIWFKGVSTTLRPEGNL